MPDASSATACPLQLRCYDGMHHGFADASGVIDAADDGIEYMGEAFPSALTPGAP